MAKKKRFMCVTECYIPLEVNGKLSGKRFRFGEMLDSEEIPNHHFMEIDPVEWNKHPRDILIELLENAGVSYRDDWTDDTLQRVYSGWRVDQRDKDDRESLLQKAKDIGAKFHHLWGVDKLKSAIETKEIEMSA